MTVDATNALPMNALEAAIMAARISHYLSMAPVSEQTFRSNIIFRFSARKCVISSLTGSQIVMKLDRSMTDIALGSKATKVLYAKDWLSLLVSAIGWKPADSGNAKPRYPTINDEPADDGA